MSSEVSRSRFSKEVRAEYVRAFKESGLNKSEFSRKHGLKRSTLHSWIERSARGSNRSQGGVEGSREEKALQVLFPRFKSVQRVFFKPLLCCIFPAV